MNGHSGEGVRQIGFLTVEEISELEAEEAYWLYYQEQQQQEQGEHNGGEERIEPSSKID